MCLILLNYKRNSRYPLIIAANRDEFYDRSAKQAHFWEDCPNILAGRDNSAGGTWMGVGKNGRIAMLTNFRAPEDVRDTEKSRGELTAAFLSGNSKAADYLTGLRKSRHEYNGYNIIFGTVKSLHYYSNKSDTYQCLSPGVYGLCNHFLDTPWWKVQRAKQRFEILTSLHNSHSGNISISELFMLLKDNTKSPDSQLPDTGIPQIFEKELSSIFVRMAEYGTRASTLCIYDREDTISYYERSFGKDGKIISDLDFFIHLV
ncbi:MAG: NRDE family protein [Gammaproteobacteria bacterium]|nr:MAG: NRDE family protein [Gammaproteobacteria bacterium]